VKYEEANQKRATHFREIDTGRRILNIAKNTSNSLLAQVRGKQNEVDKRNACIKRSQKWNDFRERRTKVMLDYFYARERQVKIKKILNYWFVKDYMKKMASRIIIIKAKKLIGAMVRKYIDRRAALLRVSC
jgi:hypothetical protein